MMFIYGLFVRYGWGVEKDEAAAQEVVAMIKKLDGKSVTLEDAKEIEKTLARYDSLSEKQKKLNNIKVACIGD